MQFFLGPDTDVGIQPLRTLPFFEIGWAEKPAEQVLQSDPPEIALNTWNFENWLITEFFTHSTLYF